MKFISRQQISECFLRKNIVRQNTVCFPTENHMGGICFVIKTHVATVISPKVHTFRSWMKYCLVANKDLAHLENFNLQNVLVVKEIWIRMT
jgi:hypothetical protein